MDALRALMPAGGTSAFGEGWDRPAPLLVRSALVWAVSRLHPRVAY